MESKEILIKLRKETKASFGLCKEASDKFPSDYEKAKEYIIELIKEQAGKREGRITQNGIIECYVHGVGSMASMVEVLCETDFVARNAELKEFAHEVALQVVAARPLYVSGEMIPEDELQEQQDAWRDELKDSGKPEKTIEMIIEGKTKKFFSETCLLDQPYFKDDSKTIRDLLEEITGKLGENIKVSRIERWQI